MYARFRHLIFKITLLKNWYQVLRPHALKKRDIVVYLRNSLVFHLRNAPGDLTVLYGIFGNGVYNGYTQITSTNPVIVDIGGHVGMFTVAAATQHRSARVIACEPDSGNAKFFLENIAKNHVESRVTLFQEPVLGEARDMTLYVNRGNSSENNMFKIKRGMEPVTMRATTLPDIVAREHLEKIDFLKIDCEGAEFDILSKMPSAILAMVKEMAIEWHGYAGYDPKDLVAVLEQAGFHTTFMNRPRMIYAKRT